MVVLTALVVLNAVATIALTHQVGVLHVRLAPLGAMQGEGGPAPGEGLSLLHPVWDDLKSKNLERIIVGFVSPSCRLCGPLLPTFNHLYRRRLQKGEALVLVTESNEERTAEYARTQRVEVPMLSVGDALRMNRITGVPFIAITDGAGFLLTSGVANSGEQLEWLIAQSRSSRTSTELALTDVHLHP